MRELLVAGELERNGRPAGRPDPKGIRSGERREWSQWPPVVASSAGFHRLRPLDEMGGVEAGSGVGWSTSSPSAHTGALHVRGAQGRG